MTTESAPTSRVVREGNRFVIRGTRISVDTIMYLIKVKHVSVRELINKYYPELTYDDVGCARDHKQLTTPNDPPNS